MCNWSYCWGLPCTTDKLYFLHQLCIDIEDREVDMVPPPYRFEPDAVISSTLLHVPVKSLILKIQLYCRCTCNHCTIMRTHRDYVCYKDLPKIKYKMKEVPGNPICCITEDCFERVCLNVWVH